MKTVVPAKSRARRRSRQQVCGRLPTAQPQGPRLVAPQRSGNDVATAAELLEGQQADRLLAERAVVTGLRRLEQIAGDLAEPILGHPAPCIVDGDQRPNALAPQQHSDAAADHTRLGVVVGGVGHELVEGVLGVLIRLTGDQNGLGEVSDPQPDPLALCRRTTLPCRRRGCPPDTLTFLGAHRDATVLRRGGVTPGSRPISGASCTDRCAPLRRCYTPRAQPTVRGSAAPTIASPATGTAITC